MKVIVAGGGGFVGRHVVAALLARGQRVVVLARGARPVQEGADVIACDVARAPVPLERLAGADAIVNLVGIKREQGTQTFEAVHVGATRRLVEAAQALGIRRFVHVSVVCSRPDAESAYHDTKWRAEELVRSSGLEATVLKPAVIYGPGDDMLTHLAKMVRFAAVFPVVGRGNSVLQPVDVRDVAEAVAASLERAASIGGSYEIVGARRLTLREAVRAVADGMGLSLAIVPTPIALMRLAVRFMNALTAVPLSTPPQLRMLSEGLSGDPEPARRDLGLVPRAFGPEAAGALAEAIPPLFGFSLRLVSRREHAAWLERRGASFSGALGLLALALLLSPALSAVIPNVWYRMAASALLLVPVALLAVDLGWRELLTPSIRRVAEGVAAAAALYLAGWAAFGLLTALPPFAAQAAAVVAWKHAVHPALVVPLLLFIIAGEEIVWRNALTLPLAARLGPWAGALTAGTAFGAAHLSLGVPLLVVAALGAGTFWSALVVKTRSAVPALVSHVLWDLGVLFWLPYGRAVGAGP